MLILLARVGVASPTLVQPEGLETTLLVAPKYQADPDAAPSRCLVRVAIGEDGVPGQVETQSCPLRQRTLSNETVRAWRWAPVELGDQPANVIALVVIDYVTKGQAPKPAAERCDYALRVGADGSIRDESEPLDQCAMWAPLYVSGAVPGGEECALLVNPRIVRSTPGWLDFALCPEGAVDLASRVLGASLFVTGTKATRVVVRLPVAASVDPTTPVASAAEQYRTVRLGGPEVVEADPGLRLEVSVTVIPDLDFGVLRAARAGASSTAAPAPAPAPAPPPPPEPAED